MEAGIKRSVSGVVLLDKPRGVSSNAALQRVKFLYKARKAGHTGSLDPLASGLLPICLGEATKISGFLLGGDKSYRFVCRLGVTTTTGDADGSVIKSHPVVFSRAQTEDVLQGFIGKIQQIPPMYSALKHEGQRLYRLARQGIEVERKPRTVVIHSLDLLRFHDDLMECQVRCSKGTYVRSLAVDIGAVLGCGAHIVELRRTGVGPYDETRMVSVDLLEARAEQGLEALDSMLLPVDTAIDSWPAVCVDSDMAHYLRTGQAVFVLHAPSGGWVRLYENGNHQNQIKIIGLGEVMDDGRIAPRRIIHSPA